MERVEWRVRDSNGDEDDPMREAGEKVRGEETKEVNEEKRGAV